MASDCQRPSIRIFWSSTSAHKRAVAPPARSERADISPGRKPRCGPRAWTEARSVSVMFFAETAYRRLLMSL